MTGADRIETDVLCIGGGIAGLMAAIRAAELGARVVVAEKGNTLTSGAGGLGNDHFVCHIPEVHGPDPAPLIEELQRGQMGPRMRDKAKTRVWIEHTQTIVQLWDHWGIPMKYQGRYEFAGHSFPGDPYPCHLKYEGKHQKRILTREALARGVRIINRVMAFELLREEGFFGALGLETRTGRLVAFTASAVILGTGTVTRLFQGVTPGWMWNATRPGTLTGDGRIMAYKAGAELVNVEALENHAGPRYFTRSGQATWVGVVRDPGGRAVGPYLRKPDRRLSDMIVEVNKNLFDEYARTGKGPVYMDCRGISEDDYAYMRHWFTHEGFDSLTGYLDEKGIDLREHPVEWATYGMRGSGGSIWQDLQGRTSLEGLYVAGDETSRAISPAAVFGWIAGEQAAKQARGVERGDSARLSELAGEMRAFLGCLDARKEGPGWREANTALQQIMSDYAGSVRSESLLEAGLTHLRRLREESRATLAAHNPHEWMRTLEVLNLMDLGELVCIAARERKESRGMHKRADYPYTDPLQDRLLFIRSEDGRPVADWR
jgi:succinate dehydrogenase/fumarate reductase flavoprotein subunit